jgi:hypothetical protein
MRHTYTWRQSLEPSLPLPPNVLNGTDHAVPFSGQFGGSPVEADVSEAWGVMEDNYGPPISGKPCIYHDGSEEVDTTSGEIQTLHPHIRVPWDDPIGDDDLVMEVLDSNGIVLVAGVMRVMITSEYAPHGPLLYRDIPLRGTGLED